MSRHVGSYSCLEEASGFSEDLHLYVEDTANPAGYPVTEAKRVVKVDNGRPALIPCRPSHPSFEVTLSKQGDVNFINMHSYHFHPRLGFIFLE